MQFIGIWGRLLTFFSDSYCILGVLVCIEVFISSIYSIVPLSLLRYSFICFDAAVGAPLLYGEIFAWGDRDFGVSAGICLVMGLRTP